MEKNEDEIIDLLNKEYSDNHLLNDYPNPVSKRKKNIVWGLAAGAAILFLVTIGLYYFPTNDQSLFEQQFTPHPGFKVDLGASSLQKQEAMSFYRAKEYSASKDLYLELIEIYPENDTINFILGNLYLIERDFNQALICLSKSIENESSLLLDKTTLYLAYTHIGLEDWETSEDLLNSLIVSDSKLVPEAEKLLLLIIGVRLNHDRR